MSDFLDSISETLTIIAWFIVVSCFLIAAYVLFLVSTGQI